MEMWLKEKTKIVEHGSNSNNWARSKFHPFADRRQNASYIVTYREGTVKAQELVCRTQANSVDKKDKQKQEGAWKSKIESEIKSSNLIKIIFFMYITLTPQRCTIVQKCVARNVGWETEN